MLTVRGLGRGALVLAGLTLFAAPVSPASAGTACDGQWRVDPSVPAGTRPFSDVSATSDGQVWVVEQPGRVLRRDHGTWTSTAPLDQPRRISARPGGAWALAGPEGEERLVRWTGSAWATVPGPVLAGQGELTSLAAVSPTEVWVVGQRYDAQGAGQGFTARWDGRQWQRHDLDPTALVLDVVAGRDGTAWAVGRDGDGARTWRWDGRSWRVEPVPAALTPGAEYADQVAVSGDGTVWVLATFGGEPHATFVLRRTERGWRELMAAGSTDIRFAAQDVLPGADPAHATVVGDRLVDDTYLAPVVQERLGGRWVDQVVHGLPGSRPEGYFLAADGDGHGGSWAVGVVDGRGVVVQRCRTTP